MLGIRTNNPRTVRIQLQSIKIGTLRLSCLNNWIGRELKLVSQGCVWSHGLKGLLGDDTFSTGKEWEGGPEDSWLSWVLLGVRATHAALAVSFAPWLLLVTYRLLLFLGTELSSFLTNPKSTKGQRAFPSCVTQLHHCYHITFRRDTLRKEGVVLICNLCIHSFGRAGTVWLVMFMWLEGGREMVSCYSAGFLLFLSLSLVPSLKVGVTHVQGWSFFSAFTHMFWSMTSR